MNDKSLGLGVKRVLIFGSFDKIHEGHRDLFRQARRQGEELHVILARDETIRQIKGKEPKYGENVRFEMLEREPLVDVVHLGDAIDKYRLIKEIAPSVIVLGYDQTAFVDDLQHQVDAAHLSCTIMRATAFFPRKYKSSLLNRAEP